MAHRGLDGAQELAVLQGPYRPTGEQVKFPVTLTLHADGRYTLSESATPVPRPPAPPAPPSTGNDKHRRNFLQLRSEDLRLARRYLQVSGQWDKKDQAWITSQFSSFGEYARFLDKYSTPDPAISEEEHRRLVLMAR